MMPSGKNREFVRGYAAALSTMVFLHGDSTEVCDALKAAGLYSVADARRAGIESYDLQILTPALRSIAAREKRLRNSRL